MADHNPHNTMNLDLNLVPVQDWPNRSVITNETPPAITKTNKNGENYLKSADSGRANLDKSTEDEGSFFDCNICLDLAIEPVVTCCGHLFCWPCLYRWLYVHSGDAKECPICKGEVTTKTVTPVYSRVPDTRVIPFDSGVKIPCRPQANRIESWRRLMQRNALNIPCDLLNGIFTSRGMRVGLERIESGLVGSTLLSHSSNIADTGLNHAPDLGSEEGLVESYILDQPDEWNQDELPLMEIDSRVSVSRRRRRRRRRRSESLMVNVDTRDSRTRRRFQ